MIAAISRWFSAPNLLYALFAYAYAFSLFTSGSTLLQDLMFASSIIDLSRMVLSDRMVCTTVMDFL